MSRKTVYSLWGALGLLSLVVSSGCNTVAGPSLGMLGFPIPVSPFFQKQAEDRFWDYERYARMPILGPITPGTPETALDEPSDDQVMRQLERARPTQGGVPFLESIQRNNVRIVKEKISDYVDDPRVYPMIGPARLHHVHYKCTVYFTEVTRVGWPFPYTTTDEESQEVIYIDLEHLHMVGNVNTGPGSNY